MPNQQLRIIGGTWRGRKIGFPEHLTLRPTPNRIRETLFNWLAPMIEGAYCLDLFAGSGALGFEALSRGAAHVDMVDASPRVLDYLKATAKQLGTTNITFHHAKCPSTDIDFCKKQFTIAFLDPPFFNNLIEKTCLWLTDNNLLAHNARIYIESEATASPLALPPNWEKLREKTAGKVQYTLLRYVTHASLTT